MAPESHPKAPLGSLKWNSRCLWPGASPQSPWTTRADQCGATSKMRHGQTAKASEGTPGVVKGAFRGHRGGSDTFSSVIEAMTSFHWYPPPDRPNRTEPPKRTWSGAGDRTTSASRLTPRPSPGLRPGQGGWMVEFSAGGWGVSMKVVQVLKTAAYLSHIQN